MFVAPVDGCYSAILHSDAFPCGRILDVGDFKSLCIGGFFLSRLREELLQLANFILVGFLC